MFVPERHKHCTDGRRKLEICVATPSLRSGMEETMKKSLEYYLSLPYRIVIVPDVEEGGYTAWYPELPGCLTCSETMEGIVVNAEEAKKAWLEAALEEGIDIVEPKIEDSTEIYQNPPKMTNLHNSVPILPPT